METVPLIVSDETLRDGEQQAGLFFPYETKKTLAQLMARSGVHYINIMPAVDESDCRLVKTLVAEGCKNIIVASTMTGKEFIDQSKACGVERITLFHAVSDRLLLLRDPEVRQSYDLRYKTIDDDIPQSVINKCRENMLNKILENLRYATSPEVGLKVEFAAEDSSRADLDFLVQCISEFKPYIEHFMLCDTVGVLTPDKTYSWISQLWQSTHARFAVHFHNDMGMALENTLQAIAAGAAMISGTFRGLGERAGNVACEQVLDGLRIRFGVEVAGIDYDAISKVTDYLDRIGARPAAPYSKEALRHESGIHINSLLQDKQSYSVFKYETPEVWFGKGSGASNLQYLFEKHLNQPLPKVQYQQMRSQVKELSVQQQRSFSIDEILELYWQGMFN